MDILQSDKSLKKMPYKVPEGYFSELSGRIPPHQDKKESSDRTIWQVLAPYAAMAAMFTLIAFAGKGIMKISSRQHQWAETEEFYYTELMPLSGIQVQFYEDDQYGYIADNNATENDIVQYLIYSGISIEEININYE